MATDFPLPTASGSARGITVGAITTSGAVAEYPLSVCSPTRLIVLGADNRLWFTEEGPSRIGRVTPAGAIIDSI